MPSASEALYQVEFGQNPSNGYEQLTNAGDDKNFFSGTGMGANLWSDANGRSPDVVIDGAITGGTISPSVTPDSVNITAATYNLSGEKDKSIISGSAISVSRPATDNFLISSVIITAAGAWDIIQGVEGTEFSNTRGAAGGPPYVDVGAIEIGHVRYSSKATGIIQEAAVQQIDGLSRETPYFPYFQAQDVFSQGGITFSQPVPAIHTGDTPKAVHALYFTPIFGEVQLGKDFTAPTESATVNSDERYGGTAASISRSLNAGSVNVLMADGHTDPILSADRDKRWTRFFSNRYKTPHVQGQAIYSIAVNYPADNNINADITMAPDSAWVQVQG